MPDNVQVENQGTGTPGTGQGAVNQGAPNPQAAPQNPPAAAGGDNGGTANAAPATSQSNIGKVGGGKNLVIPEHSMKRIKEEHFTKGKKEALSALAKELGYSSPEEMQGALKAVRAKGGSTRSDNGDGEPKPNQNPQNQPNGGKNAQQARGNNSNVDRRSWEKLDKEQKRWGEERDQLLKQIRSESSRRKELQQALDAKEAEMALRETAVISGVKDVDYAIRLLTRHLDGKTEKELATFDESKFFGELRTSHPYLFGEVVKAANTGTGTNGNPPAPKPGAAAGAAAAGGQADAKKMSREEFLAHIAKRGLSVGP